MSQYDDIEKRLRSIESCLILLMRELGGDYTVEQAARVLACKPDTIRKKARRGELRSYRSGARVMIPLDEVHRIRREGRRA